MANRTSSKRKFEVSNALSNKRKKTSPNLFCSGGQKSIVFQFSPAAPSNPSWPPIKFEKK